MKKLEIFLLTLVALVMILAVAVEGASAQSVLSLKNGNTYANSQIDTILVTTAKYTSARDITVRARWTDTVNVYFNVAWRVHGETGAWTAVAAAKDTSTYANTGELNDQFVLRSPTIDRAPGMAIDWQLILQYQSSGNGFATDNKSYIEWLYKP